MNNRKPESYPTDHYHEAGTVWDYRIGYRDRDTGVLYTTRFGMEIAVPNATMRTLPRGSRRPRGESGAASVEVPRSIAPRSGTFGL